MVIAALTMGPVRSEWCIMGHLGAQPSQGAGWEGQEPTGQKPELQATLFLLRGGSAKNLQTQTQASVYRAPPRARCCSGCQVPARTDPGTSDLARLVG